MGLALDVNVGQVTNSVALVNVTPASGDTFTVRNFNNPASARLENIIIKGGQVTTGRVLSPMFHDNVRGITALSAQAPTQFTLPRESGQPLTAQDVLTVQANSGAANSSVIALQSYYSDLPGVSQRLHSWSDIAGLVRSIKPVEVDVVASATIGNWSDTVITATENLLHANTDYALLGYAVDTACAVVAIKGPDTSNLRCGGPGSVLQDTTANYFVELSDYHGAPHVPVFNSANAGSTFVSVVDNAAGTAVKVQLILAELSQTLPN